MTTSKHEPERDLKHGWSIGVYLPKEAPPEIVELVENRIAEVVYGELLTDREGWDPFVFGRKGDLFQVNPPCECCPPHVYLSTSCFHGDHNYCKRETGLLGNKIPGVCKFCQAPCICSCHAEKESDSVDDGS